jgi:hypothetical protein
LVRALIPVGHAISRLFDERGAWNIAECHAGTMTLEDDPGAWREQLRSKLAPERIRATLAFAGLFQMAHEMIKHSVIEDVKGFYSYSAVDGGKWFWGDQGEQTYKRDVLSLAGQGQVFRASLIWLQNCSAITSAQVTRLQEIYDHRHELTHELAKFIVDVDAEPSVDLLIDAVQILRDVSRFWAQVEIDTGTFDEHGDVSVDAVQSGSVLVLDMCVQAYIEGLPKDASS